MAGTSFEGQPVTDLLSPLGEQLRDALNMLRDIQQEGSGAENREHDRQRFAGLFAFLKLCAPGQRKPQLYRIMPLDLSSRGIGFIHGTFVYPGSECTICIQDSGEQNRLEVEGKIVRCQMLTGRVHSVGVAFTESIDVTPYTKPRTGGSAQPNAA